MKNILKTIAGIIFLVPIGIGVVVLFLFNLMFVKRKINPYRDNPDDFAGFS